MIFAQIKNGMVVNTIVLDDESLASVFSIGYDYFINVTYMMPQPGMLWTFDGISFCAPTVPE